MTKKELLNAKMSSTALKEMMGQNIVVVDTCLSETDDGKQVAYLQAEDGDCYCTTSENVIRSIETINEVIAEDGAVTVIPSYGKSKQGRDFLRLKVV